MSATDTTFRMRVNTVTGRAAPATRGLLAIGAMVAVVALVPELREFVAQRAGALAPNASPAVAEADGSAAGDAAAAPGEGHGLVAEQQAVARFIARRYRVGERSATAFVSIAYRVGHDMRVDPLLILAVAAIESSYNPFAESFLGAKGLMQVIPKYHPEKLVEHGGEDALLDPKVNIQVGAKILREYLKRFGATETALQVYGGAHDEPTLQYANKVLAERARLEHSVKRAGS